MVIVYAIIMSSWKQYGGMNNFEKASQIDAYSITVNKLNLKETYQGNFDICGQLIVNGDTSINGSLTVKKGMDISGNVVIGEPGSSLTINSDSVFNGSLQLNSAFNALGNIQSKQNIIADRDVLVGRSLDFSGGSFLYSNGNALGLNTFTPRAAFDISTNLINGISISSSNNKNENILAQNAYNRGITMGVDSSSVHIYFNYDTPLPGPPDGGIFYTPGGDLLIDVSKNVNIGCPMTVSLTNNATHIHNEVFTVYDISQSVFFGNIYQNGAAYTGSAAAFVADSSYSNVSIFMGTPGGEGLSIGGGAYPLDVTKTMGTFGLTDSSGTYSPAQVIVLGDPTSHSVITTGINTYQPRINSYVLDVNGPIHVDNGDIASMDTDPPFELYSISVAPNDRNTVVALGSPVEVLKDIPTGRDPFLPNEKLLVSKTGGVTWTYVDVSNSAGQFSGISVLKGNTLNNIHLYDTTNWFITGQKSMIANSYDGGISWQNISTSGFADNSDYRNVYINPTGNLVGGNVFGYFSVDVSLVLFEIPINGPFYTGVNEKIISSRLSSISAIRANSKTIYVAGNAIAKFNASNSVVNQTPVLQWIHSYGTSYSYQSLKIFDNSYVMAVGANIISTTLDGGLSWRDISFNLSYGGRGVNFTSVHMADISNAIAVGSQGNVWITNNQGSSWAPIPLNLINPSGESQRLLNGKNQLRNVVMTDNNTILITNTLQTYDYYGNVYGRSSLFTVYAPNFINRVNNMVLDISGGVRVSGDMYINDGGLIGSNNSSFSLLNTGVKSLALGGDTTSMVMGSVIGNTEIRNNVLLSAGSASTSSTSGALRVVGGVGIVGNINVAGRMNVLSDASFNGNVIITANTSSTNVNTGALVIKGGVGIMGNLYVGGTFGFSNNLDLSGNLTVNTVTLSSGNLFSASSIMNIRSNPGLPGGTNIRIGQGDDTITINGATQFPNTAFIGNTTPSYDVNSGALVVAGGLGIGGNINMGGILNVGSDVFMNGNLNVIGFSNFANDTSFNGVLSITNTTSSTTSNTGALIISGGIGIGDSVNIGSNLTVGQSSTFIGFSNFVSDASFNGNVRITANTISSNIKTGALVIGGGLGVSGNTNIGGYVCILLDSSMNGNVSIISRTASTTSRTGALIVSGGVGIGGNINVAGFSNFVSDASFNGNVLITSNAVSMNTTSGALVVSGGVGIRGILNVGGNLNVNGTSNFTDANISGNATVNKYVITSNLISSSPSLNIGGSSISPMTITIGRNSNDICNILATLQNTSRSQTVAGTPTFVVNQQVGNATSRGSGIDIWDNSGSGIPITDSYRTNNPNIYSYIHSGNDLQSFVFKSSSYGSWNGSNYTPLDYTQPLKLISPENRVRMSVNELTLKDISNNVKRGLLILQPDISYQYYQSNRGHYYSETSYNGIDKYNDADYAINLCSDFDISNILLKNFDIVSGTQVVGTNFGVTGNALLTGNTIISGNMTISNIVIQGNIGIGTTNPLVQLDVSGSSRFVGPLISTNYDTLRFSTNYGQSIKDNLNQAITGDYYQDCAVSYDGQYQYGLLYDKTGVGSVNVSSNYGATWNRTTLPSNYSGNIIYQAVPYMSGNVTTFQFKDLAANITLANAIPLNIQAGTYVASGSSFGSGADYYNVFDNSTATSWNPFGNDYNSIGNYTGSYSTTNTPNGASVGGEYVQISLPYSFIITNYKIYDNNNSSRFPKSTYLFGSYNNLNWFSLVQSNFAGNATTTVNIINNTPYNYYRVVINSINNTSGTSSPLITRIDLSGIFQNVTGSFSSAMAASGTGQYVTVANAGYYTGQGNLITSSDYGATFTDTRIRDVSAVWQAVAMNQTGNIQVAVSQNRSGFGNIFLSYNSGSSWTHDPSRSIANGWQTVSISSSGQYITAIAATLFTSPKGNIWYSNNYGATFTRTNTQIFNYEETVNGIFNLGTNDFNKTVCVSSSGQYQTALGLALSSQMTGNANIWISQDYGVNWRDTGAKTPFINGLVSVFTSITMNGSGQNQIATYMTGNIVTGLRSQVSGNALVSGDYGNTWSTTLNYSIPSVSSSGNVYYGGVTKVQSSLNGQYVFGVSKYQDICGNTFTNTTNTVFGVGNVYLSSVPVTSGLLSTQYFGSSHTGNVFQTHGLKLSVPNVNNAALFAGYDVNWDTGYINSADQNGFNSLALNTTGGFVGVGKIAPVATLDVSGNAIISGALTIGGATNFASNVSFNTVSITSSVNSTSTTTGALTTVGGVGIGGNLNVGGFSTHAFDASFNGNIQLTKTNNPLWLVSNNASTINPTLASGNDVGIFYGSTNPASAGLVISPRGIGGGIKMDLCGNVGIGISTPYYALDVSGSIRAYSNIYLNNPYYNSVGTTSAFPTNPNLLITAGDGTINGIFNGSGSNYVQAQGLTLAGQNLYWAGSPTNNSYASSIQIDGGRSRLAGVNHGQIRLYTANSQRMVVDESGNIGIGTTNPVTPLHVYRSNIGTIATFLGNGGGSNSYNIDFCSYISPTGIPSNRISCIDDGAYSGHYTFSSKVPGAVESSLTERMRITSSGNVGIGTTSPGFTLDVNGSIRTNNSLLIGSSGAGINNGLIGVIDLNLYANNGYIYFSPKGSNNTTSGNPYNVGYYTTAGQMNAVSFNAFSDYRVKRNVEPLPTNFTIDTLRPVHYDISGGEGHDMGFLAHEVQEIFPFLVSGEKDGERNQSLNYNGFIALLVKEVQELKKENRELKERMERLEQRFM